MPNATLPLIPMIPPPPAPEPVPANWWRAAAVALANLSGLGLGYLLMRRWIAAAICLIATGILLLIALPATASGIPVGVVVLYAAFLLVVAVLGGARGLRTPLAWPPRPQIAFALAIVLLAVPISGTVLYDNAHQEAIQQMLLKRLAQADASIAAAEAEPIATGEQDFTPGLSTYQDLLDHHRTSRAAKLVPARLAAFYQSVSAPYSRNDYCGAIEPLTYLRSLPAKTISAQDLGPLAGFPDDPLATSLLQCGIGYLGGKADPTAAQDFNELLSTFPNSAQAGKVEPAVASAIVSAANGLSGSDPCTATDTLTGLNTQVKAITTTVASISAGLQKDAAAAAGDVESGTYDCAVSKYKGGDFSGAQTAMDNFVTTYPNDPNKALAQKYSIAAQIAQHDADAGKITPTLTSGGSVSITIYNDSPDPMQILYTGPATGTITVGACSSCKPYSSNQDGQQNACSDTSLDYPKTSFSLPPGTTYFLQKSSGANVNPYAHSQQFDAGTEDDLCTFETSLLGNLGL